MGNEQKLHPNFQVITLRENGVSQYLITSQLAEMKT